MNISAATKKVGLLGWPLGHSLSPIMHNAAFAACGLDFVYLPLATPPNLLPDAIAGLRAMGFTGVNLTIPHKIAVRDYLDEIDESAQLIGAVNTIEFKDGRLIGHNTDAAGYIGALELAGIDVTGKHAVVLGAGGAARAVIAGLISARIASVTIGARDPGKAAALAGLFTTAIPVNGMDWDKRGFDEALPKADLIVNTTPLGMYPATGNQPPLAWKLVKPSAIISDLIYNPLQTQFMLEGSRRGHTVVGGEGMLLEQGALAFQLWTGCEAPRAVMRQALLNVLKK